MVKFNLGKATISKKILEEVAEYIEKKLLSSFKKEFSVEVFLTKSPYPYTFYVDLIHIATNIRYRIKAYISKKSLPKLTIVSGFAGYVQNPIRFTSDLYYEFETKHKNFIISIFFNILWISIREHNNFQFILASHQKHFLKNLDKMPSEYYKIKLEKSFINPNTGFKLHLYHGALIDKI